MINVKLDEETRNYKMTLIDKEKEVKGVERLMGITHFTKK